MALSRPTPQQILTDLPLEAAREATWQAFVNQGVKETIIDRDKNVVAGTTGDGFLAAKRVASATFQSTAQGTLISFDSQAAMAGTIGGGAKGKARKLADAVEKLIEAGWTRIPDSTSPFAVNETPQTAPIAAPGAPVVAPNTGGPSYATAMPAKQGTTLLIYGVLGLTCCPIAAPFTWYYAHQALKKYGDVDPGDRSLVVVCRVLGIIGTLLVIPRFALQFGLTGAGSPSGY